MDRSTFGKYVLLRKLATGGMGEVFLAKQIGPSGFEKLLVIKRILAQHHDKREYLTMFLGEAKLVAQLTHSNIIQIHEMGQIDGDFFIAMEYVRGRSLRDVVDALRTQGKTLPLPYAIDLAIKLCDGLGYAHDAKNIRGKPMNIIHRDINPHNVLISYGGDLKIIDFGIAKSEMSAVHTATGTIKGKFVYMSPEQSAADPIDKRSDIFSLGIVLYEMITGENPFVRQNVVLSLEAIQRQPVTPPSAKRLDAGPLDLVLERALEKGPDDRYQSAYDMRDDLRNILRSGAVRAPEMDLGSFLHELFRAEIEEEDRLLAEADRATTPPRPASVDGRESAPVPPSMPQNLPSMPIFSQPPSGSSGRVGPQSASDQDTRADRALPRRTPQPLSAAPFADDEPTLAGDPDDLAARSRLQSMVSKVGGWREPTGQVLTLIPPEELAPGTHEEYGAQDPAVSPSASTSQEVPAAAPEPLPIPSAISEAPRAAALAEPFGPLGPTTGSRPPPPPRVSIPFSEEIAVPASLASSAAPVGATGANGAGGVNGTGARAPAFGALVGEAKAAERRLETGVRDTDPRGTEPRGERRSFPPDDPSGSMPAYTGLSRRTTVVAGLLVFCLAAIAGFWAVRSLMTLVPTAERPIASVAPSPTPRRLTPVLEPVRDPLAPVSPSPSAALPTASPEPSPPPSTVTVVTAPVVTAPVVAGPRASPTATPSPIAPAPRPEPHVSARPSPRAPRPEPRASAEPRAPRPSAEPRPKASPRPVADAAPIESSRPEPKTEPPPKAEPPAKAEPAAKVAEPSGRGAHLGSITLSASEDLAVEHEGRAIGSAPSSILVRKDTGTLSLSSPELPYTVRLTYRVSGEGLVVKVDASPWAIVKHNGISLGKTPQEAPEGRRHRISLIRPGQPNALDVSLLWSAANR